MSEWLVCRTPRPNARLRLFCFPYAGVGASIYRRWPRGLPDDIEVWAIQNPGRENRIRESLLPSIPELVDGILEAMKPHFALPFAMFGHSMGAVLATEIARIHAPVHLIVSGRRPPHIPPLDEPLRHLTDDEFVAELGRRYRGIPEAVRRDAALMSQLLPCLRADIHAIETHTPPLRPPISAPITVYGGEDDALTPPSHLEAWRAETTGAFRSRVFPGGHFFLEPNREAILADISSSLAV
jgi:surfactin synthase thioesterase subunit